MADLYPADRCTRDAPGQGITLIQVFQVFRVCQTDISGIKHPSQRQPHGVPAELLLGDGWQHIGNRAVFQNQLKSLTLGMNIVQNRRLFRNPAPA